MRVYIVQAYRFSDYELHSYIAGVYSGEKDAILAAEEEEKFRGGKYGCVVHAMDMDKRDTEQSVKSIQTNFFSKENYENMVRDAENEKFLTRSMDDCDWSIPVLNKISSIEDKSGEPESIMSIRIPRELSKRIMDRVSGAKNNIDNLSLVWDNTDEA
jgi:hypothetical protein